VLWEPVLCAALVPLTPNSPPSALRLSPVRGRGAHILRCMRGTGALQMEIGIRVVPLPLRKALEKDASHPSLMVVFDLLQKPLQHLPVALGFLDVGVVRARLEAHQACAGDALLKEQLLAGHPGIIAPTGDKGRKSNVAQTVSCIPLAQQAVRMQ